MKLRITIDGRAYEAEVEILEQAEEDEPAFVSNPPLPPVYPPMPSQAPGQINPVQASGGESDSKVCRSPVTGVVIKVNVEPGQAVEPNEVLMVLEAMKMETQLTSTQAGTVKSVNVAPGNSVRAHQILVEFE